ncbi:glutamine--tRNA ligase/YqeY domain fusion protein [Perlucidibaca aquatica]|uniref:glutamine--tRNA ligase/YqeY domain fusion protein n=1 Tax=Perlucidibaca aquatica TaxID=1852776 RepID=UPI00083B0873|nr:glutamine--tRNA ligase/YqeY domain fusion protein [Perlucidibaca aquatica]
MIEARDFIRTRVLTDIDSGAHAQIVTRFPPEPNGYLHIGHAKSICLNFGLAEEAATHPGVSGLCNLRFDDTNPEKESQEYIDAIQRDVQWLGFQWSGEVRYASSYFQALHDFAVELIQAGKAYVDSQTPEQIREMRGTLSQPGSNSPFRDRSIAENVDLFARMKAGEFPDGAHVLRAKIDMGSGNINLRDPILYRIRHIDHHQTGSDWCIYPMYDYTHPISDALEGITHSLCTLEFEAHRPLYDWLLEQLPSLPHPQQIEFARLNLNYTVTSKRKLKQLVDEKLVQDWDDPRMPTISGLRRRGYTPASLRNFCDRIGLSKSDGVVDVAMLEFCIREDLELSAPRAMAVLRPLKVVLTNVAADHLEIIRTVRHPNVDMGERELPLTQEIYIDRADFEEVPPKGFKRLTLGGEVRLRNAYVMRCDEVIKDAAGNSTELRCSLDLATLGANPTDRKVKGVIHWVSVSHSLPATVRLYDRLFNDASPDRGDADFKTFIHEASLETLTDARVEASLATAVAEDRFQFEREGYFCVDLKESSPAHLVFNRTVGLRDSWGKPA